MDFFSKKLQSLLPIAMLFIVVGLSIISFGPYGAQVAIGAQTHSSASYAGNLYYYWDRWDYTTYNQGQGLTYCGMGSPGPSAYCGWALGVSNPSATIYYTINAYRTDTGAEVFDGDFLPAGTPVNFVRATSTADVQYFAGGHSEDSPYGSLIQNQYGWTMPFSNDNGPTAPSADRYYDKADAGPSTQGNPWYYSASTGSGGVGYFAPTCTAGSGGYLGTSQVNYEGQQYSFDSYGILDIWEPASLSSFSGEAGTISAALPGGVIYNTNLLKDATTTNLGGGLTNLYYSGYGTVQESIGGVGYYFPVAATSTGSDRFFSEGYSKEFPPYQYGPFAYDPLTPVSKTYIPWQSNLYGAVASTTFTFVFPGANGQMWNEYYDSRNLTPNGAGCYGTGNGGRPMRSYPNMDNSPFTAFGYFYGKAMGISNLGEISNYNGGKGVATTTAGVNAGFETFLTTNGSGPVTLLVNSINNPVVDGSGKYVVYQTGEQVDPSIVNLASGTGFSGYPANGPALDAYPSNWSTMPYGNYTFQFPSASISFHFNFGTTTPPSTPTISGPATGTTDVAYTFTGSKCVDPNNTRVDYGFDWNWGSEVQSGAAHGVNTWSPYYPMTYYGFGDNTLSVPSGSSSSATRTWTTPGTYTIGMNCQTLVGAVSPWATPATISIVYPLPTITLAFNNSTSTPQTFGIRGNVTPQLAWSTTNATNCQASGDWSGKKNTSSGEDLTINATGTYNYILSCGGLGGTTTKSMQINAVISPPILHLYIDGREKGNVTRAQGYGDQIYYSVYSADTCTATRGPLSDEWSGNKGTSTFNSYTVNQDNYDYENNTHSYLDPGTYIYSLSCSGPTGVATSSVTLNVTQHPPVISYCSPDPYSAAPGDPVTWSAYVYGGVTPYTYSWTERDFDGNWNPVASDGQPSLTGKTDLSPITSYSQSGNKSARLTVTDNVGLSVTADCYSANVPNPPPKVTISGPIEGRVGEPITFTATGIEQDNYVGYDFRWYDGVKGPETPDGSTFVEEWLPNPDNGWGSTWDDYVPSGTAITSTNTWTTPGVYTFKAVIYDPYGNRSDENDPDASHTITIKDDTCTGGPDNNSTNVADWIMPDQDQPGDTSTTTYSWSDDRGLISGSDRFAGPQRYPNGTTTATVTMVKDGVTKTESCSVHIPFTYHNQIPTDLLVSLNNGSYKSGTIPAVVGNTVTLIASTTAKYCVASGNDDDWALRGAIATNTSYAMNYTGGLQQPSKRYVLQCGNTSVDDIVNGIGDISTSIINLIITLTKEI